MIDHIHNIILIVIVLFKVNAKFGKNTHTQMCAYNSKRRRKKRKNKKKVEEREKEKKNY